MWDQDGSFWRSKKLDHGVISSDENRDPMSFKEASCHAGLIMLNVMKNHVQPVLSSFCQDSFGVKHSYWYGISYLLCSYDVHVEVELIMCNPSLLLPQCLSTQAWQGNLWGTIFRTHTWTILGHFRMSGDLQELMVTQWGMLVHMCVDPCAQACLGTARVELNLSLVKLGWSHRCFGGYLQIGNGHVA
jgi:hypothetical protein